MLTNNPKLYAAWSEILTELKIDRTSKIYNISFFYKINNKANV